MSLKQLKSFEEYQKDIEHNKRVRETMINELKGNQDFSEIEKYLPTFKLPSYENYKATYLAMNELPKTIEENGALETKTKD